MLLVGLRGSGQLLVSTAKAESEVLVVACGFVELCFDALTFEESRLNETVEYTHMEYK